MLNKGVYSRPSWAEEPVVVKRQGKNIVFLLCGCVQEEGQEVKLCPEHQAELNRVCTEDVLAEPVVAEPAEKIEGPEFMGGSFDALWTTHTPITMAYVSSSHADENRRVLPVSPVWLDWKRGTKKFFAIDMAEFEDAVQDYYARRDAWLLAGQPANKKPAFVGPPTKTFFANEARRIRVGTPIPSNEPLALYAQRTHAFKTYSQAS